MPHAHAIQPAEPGLDERRLRAAFGRFATGVASDARPLVYFAGRFGEFERN
jgi:hypothetical protein